MKKPLPIGVDDFEILRTNNYYYVDKTLLIKELLDKKGAVNLFTRPRRFGKTLNMSMLRYFFEDTENEQLQEQHQSLFYGLNIMGAGDKYTCEMGKYPVICINLKSGKQRNFQSAYNKLRRELSGEFDRHRKILDSLVPEKAVRYQKILNETAGEDDFSGALQFLSEVLWDITGRKSIILIDEYDVPLENAYFNGFYDEMSDFVRSLFESALKSNPYLEFGVITGCLRITKESIFTGLNNMKMISVLSELYDEYFGFTQFEIDTLLNEYGRSDKEGLIKQWYNGYRFGKTEVYNPWSVINYLDALRENSDAIPVPYWANTSSNDIVRNLIDHADMTVKKEMEELLSGNVIEKPVYEEITYDSIYNSTDNLWNFLFFTGYLRMVSLRMEGRNRMISMRIPNEEVAYIYENTITGWFRDEIQRKDLTVLYNAMLDGDAEKFQQELSSLLLQTISYMDSGEKFYHGFLLGILGNLKEYYVTSNRESGTGRYDILVQSPDVTRVPVIMELKAAGTFKELDVCCDMALEQIEEKQYGASLSAEGYSSVILYGIAFFKKQCRIKVIRKTY